MRRDVNVLFSVKMLIGGSEKSNGGREGEESSGCRKTDGIT